MDRFSNWLGQLTGVERPLVHLPRPLAFIALALFAAMLVWSSLAVPQLAAADEARVAAKAQAGAAANQEPAIGDFELYSRIHQRVAAGEGYYGAALAEQRAHDYPTRPFVTVRLPSLAWSHALLGPQLVGYGAVALLVAVIALFLPALQNTSNLAERVGGAVLILLGGAGVFADQAAYVHELIAGLLLSLALVAYRPHRLWPSLVLVALALALRELAVPFVLAWLALASMRRNWREAGILAGLLAVFALGLYLHYLGVTAHVLPTDRASPGWDGMVGPALPLLALSQLTALLFLPLWLAGPLALLALLGWIGIGGRVGIFSTIWFAGFFLAMSLFARAENFYWVAMVLPLYCAGLAFAPRAFGDLARACARGKASLS